MLIGSNGCLLVAAWLGFQPASPPARPSHDTATSAGDGATAGVAGDPGVPAPMGHATRGGLTVDEVARRARQASPRLAEAGAEREAARARVRAARVGYVPQLELSASYTRLSSLSNNLGGSLVGAANEGPLSVGPCPGGGGECVVDSAGTPVAAQSLRIDSVDNNYSAALRGRLPLTQWVVQVPAQVRSAKLGVEAAQAQHDATVRAVEAMAKIAYYDWLRALTATQVAGAAVDRVAARYREVSDLASLGAAGQDDMLRLERGWLGAKERRSVLAGTEEIARQKLALELDAPADSLAPGSELRGRQRSWPTEESTASLISRALSQRVELTALRRGVAALESQERAAKVDAWPQLDVFGEALVANPNPRIFPPQPDFEPTWAVGASVTVQLPRVIAAGPQADGIAAQRRAQTAAYQSMAREVKLQVVAATVARRTAVEAIELAEAQVVAARGAYEIITARHQEGQVAVAELIDAEGELVQAELAVVDAWLRLRRAEVELGFAVGHDHNKRAP
ncbi:MAG: TolC family protein [Myxococcales bacterium FL481]|nr:MAG: TolC family protein [Myxococcales bacterium FL481]